MTEVLNRALLNAPHVLEALCAFAGVSGGMSGFSGAAVTRITP